MEREDAFEQEQVAGPDQGCHVDRDSAGKMRDMRRGLSGKNGFDRLVRSKRAAVREGHVGEEQQFAGEEPTGAEDERARQTALTRVGDILLGDGGRHDWTVYRGTRRRGR